MATHWPQQSSGPHLSVHNDPRYQLDTDAMSDAGSIPGSVPLPSEDFEPFFNDFTDYDAALEQSINIQELNIPQNPHQVGHYKQQSMGTSLRLHYPADIQSKNQLQLQQPFQFESEMKPTQITRYAEMNLYSEDMSSPQKPVLMGLDPHSPTRQPPGFNIPSSPPAMRRSNGHSQSGFGDFGPNLMVDPLGISTHNLAPPPQLNYNRIISQAPVSPHLGVHGSPAALFSPRTSPHLQSPYFSEDEHQHNQHNQHLHIGQHGHMGMSPGASPLVGSLPNSGPVEWQPILTIPKNPQSEEIIRSQGVSPSKARRKSCLPPGAVDEYMEGPDNNDDFHCLYPNCGRLFKRRYNLRSHIQTHLCDRPYLCSLCPSTFVRPHDLRRHMRCHSTAKPYLCPCGKGFTRMDALQRHRQRMICVGGVEGCKTDPRRKKSPSSTPSSASSTPQLPYTGEMESSEFPSIHNDIPSSPPV